MSRSTYLLLATAVVLGLVTWFVTRSPPREPPPRVNLAGFATAAELEADRARSILDEAPPLKSPIDELRIEWPEREHIVLKLITKGDKPIWRIVEPVVAPAHTFAVEQIITLFKTPTQSRETRPYSEADARLFGFEASSKARLTLKSGGAVWNGVDLYLGDVRQPRGQDSAEPDTWVMPVGASGHVFAIHAKDLRAPLRRGLEGLRDTRLFEFEVGDVARVALAPARGDEVTLEPVAGPATNETPRLAWSISEPPGVDLDTTGQGFVTQLLGLRAKTFTKLAALAPDDRAALETSTSIVTVGLKDGSAIFLRLVQQADGAAIGQITGQDEAFTLSKWSAAIATQGLADLRERRFAPIDPAAVTALEVQVEDGRASATRRDGAWTVSTKDDNVAADPAAYIQEISALRAARWARPAELEEARAALAEPALTASLTTDRGPVTLSFGEPFQRDGQELRWGTAGGGHFLVSDFMARKVATTVRALRLTRLFPLPSDAIVQVEVRTADGGGYTLTRPTPTAPLSLVGVTEGQSADPQKVAAIVAQILALEADAFEVDTRWRDQEAETATIALEDRDGTRYLAAIRQGATSADPLAKLSGGRLSGAVVKLSPLRTAEILVSADALCRVP